MPKEAHSSLISFAKHWGNFAVRQFALGVLPLDGKSVVGPGRSDLSGWYLQKKYMKEIHGYSKRHPEPDKSMSHILKAVQDRLLSYAAVGILEEFNMTLSLYNTVLGIPGVRWHEGYRKIGIANAGKFRYSGSPNFNDDVTPLKTKPGWFELNYLEENKRYIAVLACSWPQICLPTHLYSKPIEFPSFGRRLTMFPFGVTQCDTAIDHLAFLRCLAVHTVTHRRPGAPRSGRSRPRRSMDQCNTEDLH